VIVRIVLWRLDESTPPIDELRHHVDDLEPLPSPSVFLVNEGAERIGILLLDDEGDDPPPQLDELRRLVGRDPDLYEEFDAL
jgi:hypothetical protein